MAALLGTGLCAIRGCTSRKARYTLSSAGLAVLTDKVKGGCQSQAFARDEEGDELFRACIIPPGASTCPYEDGIAESGDVGQVHEAAPPPPPPPPAPSPSPEPVATESKPKVGWGLFAGRDA